MRTRTTHVMLGDYRLDGLLARGGMGEVYRAYDTRLGREVALKLLSSSLAADPEFRARFRRESEIARALQDPHIVPIHDSDEIDGQLFIDMPLIRGRDLSHVVADDGPLAPSRGVALVAQVAEALDAAHTAGLVHRDVKPSNVLITPKDFAYLTDFGIARSRDPAVGRFTRPGVVFGTPDFMAPELFMEPDADARADVYALGCVLVHCLTGTPPFVATAVATVREQHLHGERPSVGAHALDAVVRRAMAVAPDDRYTSAGELARAAADALRSGAGPVTANGAGPAAPAPSGGPQASWWPRPAAGSAGPEPSTPAPGTLGAAGPRWTVAPEPDPSPAAAGAQAPPTAPPAAPWPSTDPVDLAHVYWASAGPPSASPAPPGVPEPPASWIPEPPATPPPTPEPSPTGHGSPPLAESPEVWWQGRFTAVHAVADESLHIGRAADNDVVVDDLLVALHHAEVRPDWAGRRIVDLASPSGTFLNGKRITSYPIVDGDVVGVGHTLLHFVGDRLVEYVDVGSVAFQAEDLVVDAEGTRLLDEVSFSLPQRSVLAVVGPSGVGKTTLLDALTGFRPADDGRVHYAGRDLYDDYDELRQRIGLVPQEDILHPELTVERALRYAAELRFPADVAASERRRRVDEVIDELGLGGQRRLAIAKLSGGQRKRTSVALEMLTKPSLLFLDEPTTGLDPNLDHEVMAQLRRLADGGRTVVVVTHNILNLDVCDRLLVMAHGGRVAYFGPPEEALAFFEVSTFVELFHRIDPYPNAPHEEKLALGARLKQNYRRSPDYDRHVDLTPAAVPATAPDGAPGALGPPSRPRSPASQFRILARRYLAVVAADRAYSVFLLALPLVLAALLWVVPDEAGLSVAEKIRTPRGQGGPQIFLLVLLMSAAFMGFAASFRELVKERPVFRREQAVGISLGAYLASKLAVIGGITALQGAALGGAALVISRRPPDTSALGNGPVEIVVAVIAVTVAMAVLGLLVSAWISNPDRGMPVLVVVLMLQMVLCGVLFPVDELPAASLSWLVVTRWGLAMAASTTGLGRIAGHGGEPDALWANDSWIWIADLAALGALTALGVAGTALMLRRVRRPGRR